MASLRDIKRRTNSVQSTRQVTRTMEMVSTAKIRRAQSRIEHARPYALALASMLAKVTQASKKVKHPLLAVRKEQKVTVCVCIASDRGQAGAFNSNIIALTEAYLQEKEEQNVEVQLIACGKKLNAYFKQRGIEPALALEGFSGSPEYTDAKLIADRVIRQYSDAEIDEVVTIYNRFINVADQRPETSVLLPARNDEIVEQVEDAPKSRRDDLDYLFEPDAKDVLRSLLPTYVETLVYRALLESAVSEHAARRTAMKAATDNATEMIATLTRSYNRARQAAITTEISEIVGGAAALEG
ncbi:MAG: ATP synthase F1 subunit gamma [Coriobacteriia bacterium]|nr:ATP synthase F1 subunit gamma [Coriobacteriia bacterium]